MTVYQVANWNGNFENNKSRGYDRCTFVCVPNKLDGMGLRWILKEPDGPAVYGMFHLILCRCSKQTKPRDGWLTDNGRREGSPLTAEDLGAMFGRPVSEVQRALDVLSSSRIGWIVCHRQADAGADNEGRDVTPPTGYIDTAPTVPAQCPDSDREVPVKCLGTEPNRTELKNGNGRSHSTHQVSTTTQDTGVDTGAPPPLLKKQPGENDNGEELRQSPQEKTPDTKIPLQDDTKRATTTQTSTSTPPAADREPEASPASAIGSPETKAATYRTAAERRARPAEAQASLSALGELMRRWGWKDEHVRRVLKWLIERYQAGKFVECACEGDYWNVLAFAKQIEERRASGREVKDPVSLLIHMLTKGYHPQELNYKMARTAWCLLDDETERIEPIWMREVLAGIGRPVNA